MFKSFFKGLAKHPLNFFSNLWGAPCAAAVRLFARVPGLLYWRHACPKDGVVAASRCCNRGVFRVLHISRLVCSRRTLEPWSKGGVGSPALLRCRGESAAQAD